jgi:hypothetical protein
MPEEEKEHVVTRVLQICADIKVFHDYNWMNPLQETRDDRVERVHREPNREFPVRVEQRWGFRRSLRHTRVPYLCMTYARWNGRKTGAGWLQ